MSTATAPSFASELSKIPLFQANQILTNRHLNELVEYLTGQHQLTRKLAVGTGIISGMALEVTLGDTPTLTLLPGSGITSEGFMLQMDTPREMGYKCEVTDFVPYEELRGLHELETEPVFTFENGDILELLTEDNPDDNTVSALAEADLKDRVYIIFVYRYESTTESCFTTSCDENGGSITYSIRHLLIRREKVQAWLDNPREGTETKEYNAFEKLDLAELRMPEVNFNTNALESYEVLRKQYLHKLEDYLPTLQAEIYRIQEIVQPLLGYGTSTLSPTFLKTFLIENLAIAEDKQLYHQYLYDFFRDLTDAYNELRERLLELLSLDFTDVRGFPYHLMVGHFSEDAAWSHYRYRHHWRSRTYETNSRRIVSDIRTLYRRMFSLRDQFMLGLEEIPVRRLNLSHSLAKMMKGNPLYITPSQHTLVPLGQRPLPFYYYPGKVENGDGLWPWRWYGPLQRNLAPQEHSLTGFHFYGMQNVVDRWQTKPLDVVHDEAVLMRIEGLQGQTLSGVKHQINNLRQNKGLAFDVVYLPFGKAAEDTIPNLSQALPLPAGFADLQEHYQSHVAYFKRTLRDVLWFWGKIEELFTGKDEKGVLYFEQILKTISEDTPEINKYTGEEYSVNTDSLDPAAFMRVAKILLTQIFDELKRLDDPNEKLFPECLNEFDFLKFREIWKNSIPWLLEVALGTATFTLPWDIVEDFIQEFEELKVAIEKAPTEEEKWRFQQQLNVLEQLFTLPDSYDTGNAVTVKLGAGLYRLVAQGTKYLSKEAGKEVKYMEGWLERMLPELSNRTLDWLVRGTERLMYSQFQSLYLNYLSRLDAWYQVNARNLAEFWQLHPGMRHLAGSWADGTFIVAYDTRDGKDIVVADYTLPYRCCGGPAPKPICDPTRLGLYPIPPMAYPDFSHVVHEQEIVLDVRNNDLRADQLDVILLTDGVDVKGTVEVGSDKQVYYTAPTAKKFSGFEIIPYRIQSTQDPTLYDESRIHIYVWDGVVGSIRTRYDNFCVVAGGTRNLDVVKNDELIDDTEFELQIQDKNYEWHGLDEAVEIYGGKAMVVQAATSAGYHEHVPNYKMVEFSWAEDAYPGSSAEIRYRVRQHKRPWEEGNSQVSMIIAQDDRWVHPDHPNSAVIPVFNNDSIPGNCPFQFEISKQGGEDFVPTNTARFTTANQGEVYITNSRVEPLDASIFTEPWDQDYLIWYDPKGNPGNKDYFYYRLEKDGNYTEARVDIILPILITSPDSACVVSVSAPTSIPYSTPTTSNTATNVSTNTLDTSLAFTTNRTNLTDTSLIDNDISLVKNPLFPIDVVNNDLLVDEAIPFRIKVINNLGQPVETTNTPIPVSGGNVYIQQVPNPQQNHPAIPNYKQLAFQWNNPNLSQSEATFNYVLEQYNYPPVTETVSIHRVEAIDISLTLSTPDREIIAPLANDIVSPSCEVWLALSAEGGVNFSAEPSATLTTQKGGKVTLISAANRALSATKLKEAWNPTHQIRYEIGENITSADYFFYRYQLEDGQYSEARVDLALPTLEVVGDAYTVVDPKASPQRLLVAENDTLVDFTDFTLEVKNESGAWVADTGSNGILVNGGRLQVVTIPNPQIAHPNINQYQALTWQWETSEDTQASATVEYRLLQGGYSPRSSTVSLQRLSAKDSSHPLTTGVAETFYPLTNSIIGPAAYFKVELSAEGGGAFAITEGNLITTQGGVVYPQIIAGQQGTALAYRYDRGANGTTSDYFYFRLITQDGSYTEAKVDLTMPTLDVKNSPQCLNQDAEFHRINLVGAGSTLISGVPFEAEVETTPGVFIGLSANQTYTDATQGVEYGIVADEGFFFPSLSSAEALFIRWVSPPENVTSVDIRYRIIQSGVTTPVLTLRVHRLHAADGEVTFAEPEGGVFDPLADVVYSGPCQSGGFYLRLSQEGGNAFSVLDSNQLTTANRGLVELVSDAGASLPDGTHAELWNPSYRLKYTRTGIGNDFNAGDSDYFYYRIERSDGSHVEAQIILRPGALPSITTTPDSQCMMEGSWYMLSPVSNDNLIDNSDFTLEVKGLDGSWYDQSATSPINVGQALVKVVPGLATSHPNIANPLGLSFQWNNPLTNTEMISFQYRVGQARATSAEGTFTAYRIKAQNISINLADREESALESGVLIDPLNNDIIGGSCPISLRVSNAGDSGFGTEKALTINTANSGIVTLVDQSGTPLSDPAVLDNWDTNYRFRYQRGSNSSPTDTFYYRLGDSEAQVILSLPNTVVANPDTLCVAQILDEQAIYPLANDDLVDLSPVTIELYSGSEWFDIETGLGLNLNGTRTKIRENFGQTNPRFRYYLGFDWLNADDSVTSIQIDYRIKQAKSLYSTSSLTLYRIKAAPPSTLPGVGLGETTLFNIFENVVIGNPDCKVGFAFSASSRTDFTPMESNTFNTQNGRVRLQNDLGEPLTLTELQGNFGPHIQVVYERLTSEGTGDYFYFRLKGDTGGVSEARIDVRFIQIITPIGDPKPDIIIDDNTDNFDPGTVVSSPTISTFSPTTSFSTTSFRTLG